MTQPMIGLILSLLICLLGIVALIVALISVWTKSDPDKEVAKRFTQEKK